MSVSVIASLHTATLNMARSWGGVLVLSAMVHTCASFITSPSGSFPGPRVGVLDGGWQHRDMIQSSRTCSSRGGSSGRPQLTMAKDKKKRKGKADRLELIERCDGKRIACVESGPEFRRVGAESATCRILRRPHQQE